MDIEEHQDCGTRRCVGGAADGRDGGGRDPGRGRRLDELVAVYRADRKRRGPQQADGDWVERGIEDWLDNLCGRHDDGMHACRRDPAMACDDLLCQDGAHACGRGRACRHDGEDIEPAEAVEAVEQDGPGSARDCGDDSHGACGRLRPASVDALAVGMSEAHAVRDALIVSLVAGPRALDKRVLMDFVTRPRTPHTCGMMGRMLSKAFRSPSAKVDPVICGRGVAMLLQIVQAVPDRFRIQPLTAVAYVLWWSGDGVAEAYARRALLIGEHCSLASIVLRAMRHGIYPAYHGEDGPAPAEACSFARHKRE